MMSRLIGASLLVAGTSIGAAMLALPLASALAGFKWSLVILVASWFFMYSTGLCIIEVESAFKERSSSFISLAEHTLGQWSGKITALTFFCLLYSLLAAYITGGGDIVQAHLVQHFGSAIPQHLGLLLWTALFALIIYLGIFMGDRVNRFLMFSLFLAYIVLVYYLGQHVTASNLAHSDARYVWVAIPIVFTAHAYHIVIPSVYHYLDDRAELAKKALLLGSAIPLVLYAIWEYIVFGVIPLKGEISLMQLSHSSHTTADLTTAFQMLSHSYLLGEVSRAFVFFAIASSFLGVSLGLFDLIKDAATKWQINLSRLSQLIITFLPGLVFGLVYPQGFLIALAYAGIFVAALHGILPVLMVIAKRSKGMVSSYQLPGGYFSLATLMLFYLLVIVLDISAI